MLKSILIPADFAPLYGHHIVTYGHIPRYFVVTPIKGGYLADLPLLIKTNSRLRATASSAVSILYFKKHQIAVMVTDDIDFPMTVSKISLYDSNALLRQICDSP
jgi:hypothetical protein